MHRTLISKKLGFLALTLMQLVVGSPAQAQSKAQLEKIDRFLQQKRGNIPGLSIAIVNRSQVTFSKGYGHSSDGQPITANTPFAIASLSKGFTALAIMQLVEAGKIRLDSSVCHYLPSFPVCSAQITVRQLLNQTSGLSDHLFPEMQYYTQPTNLAESIDRLRNTDLSLINKTFHYHNPNYQILARIVEVVSKENFSSYLHTHIFQLFQMRHTRNFASTADFYSKGNLSRGHAFIFGYPLPKTELDWFVQGSAGMVSTTHDMAQWLILNLNEGTYATQQLLSKKGIQTMMTPPTDTQSSYGMGWYTDHQGNKRHNGILWTYQSDQLLLKKQGYGIVILFNGGLNSFQDYSAFMRGITAILNDQEPDTEPASGFLYEGFVASAILLFLIFALRRVKRMPDLLSRYRQKSKLKIVLGLALRLLPLLVLLSVPTLITALSGRVLNWQRIFWMMPSVCMWLVFIALFNLGIVGYLIIKLYRENSIFQKAETL